jgi:hypothetical protein
MGEATFGTARPFGDALTAAGGLSGRLVLLVLVE